MKKLLAIAFMGVLAGCGLEADVASTNLSQAADMFQIQRKITFYNGITDTGILTIEGLCSLRNYDKTGILSVTCKTGPSSYKKHFLGLSDNVTFLAEQIDAAEVSVYHYKVVLKPSVLVPDIDIK